MDNVCMFVASKEEPHIEILNQPFRINQNIGLSYVSLQIQRKARRQSYYFSLMVVGSAGLGKSTFINTVFLAKAQSSRPYQLRKTMEIKATKFTLVERGVRIHFTVYDTPGFGDLIDDSSSIDKIEEEINKRFEEYLTQEMEILRKSRLTDRRIHCCLYFISPNSGLKELDIEAMKRLQDKVNIIPIIAKADTLTPEERDLMKKSILNELVSNGISVYDFPVYARELKTNKLATLKNRSPFAVVSSEVPISKKPKKYGRKYPWGTVEIENTDHSDIMALKLLILNSHLGDLIDATHRVHYEVFRKKRLSSIKVDNKLTYLTTNQLKWNFEEEKKLSENYLSEKEKKIKRLFEIKIQDKEEKLKRLADSLNEQTRYANKILSKEKKALNQRRRYFDREKQLLESTVYGLNAEGYDIKLEEIDLALPKTVKGESSPPYGLSSVEDCLV